jgi:hypothetical protein
MHDNGYPFRKFRRASPSVSDGVFLDCPCAERSAAGSRILLCAVTTLPGLAGWRGVSPALDARQEEHETKLAVNSLAIASVLNVNLVSFAMRERGLSRHAAKDLSRPSPETREHITRCFSGNARLRSPISRGAYHVGWTQKQQKWGQCVVPTVWHSDERCGDHRAACR